MKLLNEIKLLRKKTSSSMSDCKWAIQKSNGNIEKAIKFLKEKGAIYTDQAKSLSNIGYIFTYIDLKKYIVIKIQSETEFSLKSKYMKDFANNILKYLTNIEYIIPQLYRNLDDINLNSSDKNYLNNLLKEAKFILKENIHITNIIIISKVYRIIGKYIHHNNLTGAIISLELNRKLTDKDNIKTINKLAADIAMHVLGFKPLFLKRNYINNIFLKNQKDLIIKQNIDTLSSKTSLVKKNIIGGILKKYLSNISLLSQSFIKNDKKHLQEIVKTYEISLSMKINIIEYFII